MPCAWCRPRGEEKGLTLSARIAPGPDAARRPARAQADRAQSAVECGEVHRRSGQVTVRGRRVGGCVLDRHQRYRHRHRAGRAGAGSGGRSSRSKASSPRPITARGSASRSPNRWSNCMAAACASARRPARHHGAGAPAGRRDLDCRTASRKPSVAAISPARPEQRLRSARAPAPGSRSTWASSVAKSGTSAARASSRSRPGSAFFGSNGPDRHSRRIWLRF